MKQSLLRQELILDTEDRAQLCAELSGLGLLYKTDGHIVVPHQGRTAQEIITRIHTPLTMLKIHEPSLEDAYIEFLKEARESA